MKKLMMKLMVMPKSFWIFWPLLVSLAFLKSKTDGGFSAGDFAILLTLIIFGVLYYRKIPTTKD